MPPAERVEALCETTRCDLYSIVGATRTGASRSAMMSVALVVSAEERHSRWYLRLLDSLRRNILDPDNIVISSIFSSVTEARRVLKHCDWCFDSRTPMRLATLVFDAQMRKQPIDTYECARKLWGALRSPAEHIWWLDADAFLLRPVEARSIASEFSRTIFMTRPQRRHDLQVLQSTNRWLGTDFRVLPLEPPWLVEASHLAQLQTWQARQLGVPTREWLEALLNSTGRPLLLNAVVLYRLFLLQLVPAYHTLVVNVSRPGFLFENMDRLQLFHLEHADGDPAQGPTWPIAIRCSVQRDKPCARCWLQVHADRDGCPCNQARPVDDYCPVDRREDVPAATLDSLALHTLIELNHSEARVAPASTILGSGHEPRFALILTGLSWAVPRAHYWPWLSNWAVYKTDYRESLANYRARVLGSFTGWGADVFCVTNPSPVAEQLLRDYTPRAALFLQARPRDPPWRSKQQKLLAGVRLCIEAARRGVSYSMVVITRFDLLFSQPIFPTLRTDSLNVVSHLERPNLIDDNFYAMPLSMLPSFAEIVRDHSALYASHKAYLEQFRKRQLQLHIMHEERRQIEDLTFFCVVRISNFSFQANGTSTRRRKQQPRREACRANEPRNQTYIVQ